MSQSLQNERSESSEASKEAERKGLTHVGFGMYKNKSGMVVAKSVNGKLRKITPRAAKSTDGAIQKQKSSTTPLAKKAPFQAPTTEFGTVFVPEEKAQLLLKLLKNLSQTNKNVTVRKGVQDGVTGFEVFYEPRTPKKIGEAQLDLIRKVLKLELVEYLKEIKEADGDSSHEDSQAGEEAKKRGLTHKGWGKYADKTGNIVAKSVNGKLVDIDPNVGDPEVIQRPGGHHLVNPNLHPDLKNQLHQKMANLPKTKSQKDYERDVPPDMQQNFQTGQGTDTPYPDHDPAVAEMDFDYGMNRMSLDDEARDDAERVMKAVKYNHKKAIAGLEKAIAHVESDSFYKQWFRGAFHNDPVSSEEGEKMFDGKHRLNKIKHVIQQAMDIAQSDREERDAEMQDHEKNMQGAKRPYTD